MAIRKQWTGLEILLFMILIAICGCTIAGGVLLVVAGWAWVIIPLSLLPYIFQVLHHHQHERSVSMIAPPSQALALCSSVAAAQKPQPRDRTCANSVVWVVLMLLIGSLASAFYCVALLALYTACVCPSCAVGQPGAIFDTYVHTGSTSTSSSSPHRTTITCSTGQNIGTLMLGCASGVLTLWGLCLLAYDLAQRSCCNPAVPDYLPPTPEHAAAILAGAAAVPLPTHYAVDVDAVDLPSVTKGQRVAWAGGKDGRRDKQALFDGEVESVPSDLIAAGHADERGERSHLRLLAPRGSRRRDGPPSPRAQFGRWDEEAPSEYSGDLVMPPRLRAAERPADWEDDSGPLIAPVLQSQRSYTPFSCGPPGGGGG